MDFVSEEGLIVAIDFDNTIVNSSYPELGAPKEYAVKALQDIKRAGVRVAIWTCRDNLQPVREFLDFYGIEVDAINSNDALTQVEWDKFSGNDSRKIGADIYVEDRDIHIIDKEIDWLTISKKIIKIINGREG
jgi:hydroxymethylpyrimidine pyrophosphatase-like HAD family hydrolase